ncbi:MAG TPA: hypothetical protein VD993_10500 [Chitinophagaceae bacterium]|nr:hypothetical protein [Chitinophagaceae bacterium]
MKSIVPRTLIAIIAISISALAKAQDITLPELIKLRSQSVEEMKKFAESKGYTQDEDSTRDGQRQVMYSHVSGPRINETARILIYRQNLKSKDFELDYSSTVDSEADSARAWLKKNGFRQTGRTKPREQSTEYIFSKGSKLIRFQETEITTDERLYSITIKSKEYAQ